MTKQISCDAHDYFEIVAMRKSAVRITTFDNQEISGTAADIVRKNQQEHLVLIVEGEKQLISLTNVKSLDAENNAMEQHNLSIDFS